MKVWIGFPFLAKYGKLCRQEAVKPNEMQKRSSTIFEGITISTERLKTSGEACAGRYIGGAVYILILNSCEAPASGGKYGGGPICTFAP